MSEVSSDPENHASGGSGLLTRWLEALTAALLLAVIAALVWIVVRAKAPERTSIVPERVEVMAVVILLVAALVLVCSVALLRTRREGG